MWWWGLGVGDGEELFGSGRVEDDEGLGLWFDWVVVCVCWEGIGKNVEWCVKVRL